MFPKNKIHKTIYCVYCMREVHEKEDGGRVNIPLCLSGRFTEEVYLHDKCLNPYINYCNSTRIPFKKEVF